MTDNSVVLTKPPVILSCYETSHPTFVLMIVSQILVVCYISYLHHLMRSLHPRNGVLGPDQDQVGSAGVLLDCWGDVLHTLHNALPSGEKILLCENKNIFLVARWLTIMRQTPSTVKTPGSSNRFAACSPPSRPTKPPVRREPRGWRTTLETSSVARYEAASHWSMLSIL